MIYLDNAATTFPKPPCVLEEMKKCDYCEEWNKEDVIKNWAIDRVFEPAIEEEERKKRIKGWNKAVKYACGRAKED